MNYYNNAGNLLKVTDTLIKKILTQTYNNPNLNMYRLTELEQHNGVEVIRHCCNRGGIQIKSPTIHDVNGTTLKYMFCNLCGTVIYAFAEEL